MSAKTFTCATVRCDEASCTAFFEGRGACTEVRRQAGAAGWLHAVKSREPRQAPFPTFDWCPDHHGELARVGAVAVSL